MHQTKGKLIRNKRKTRRRRCKEKITKRCQRRRKKMKTASKRSKTNYKEKSSRHGRKRGCKKDEKNKMRTK